MKQINLQLTGKISLEFDFSSSLLLWYDPKHLLLLLPHFWAYFTLQTHSFLAGAQEFFAPGRRVP